MSNFWGGFEKQSNELPKTTISEGAATGGVAGGLIGALIGGKKKALPGGSMGAALGAAYGATPFARGRQDKRNKKFVNKYKKLLGEEKYQEALGQYNKRKS